MTRKTKRTDIHTPSRIVPSDYEHVFSYNGSTTVDGWPIPSFGYNCEIDYRNPETLENGSHRPDGLCCLVGLARTGRKIQGEPEKCTVCGTRFVYGEVWRHVPSDTFIHVGNICGHKYGLYMDRSRFDYEAKKATGREIARLEREKRAKRCEELIEKYDLAEAFEADHEIIRDIREQMKRKGWISEKQVALVKKLAKQVSEPVEEEMYVDAPTGKAVEFEGVIVSVKEHYSQYSRYGGTLKMTMKMRTDRGIWLAWGTLPSALCGHGGAVGMRAKIKAELRPGRDKHFVFMKRPRVISFEASA